MGIKNEGGYLERADRIEEGDRNLSVLQCMGKMAYMKNSN